MVEVRGGWGEKEPEGVGWVARGGSVMGDGLVVCGAPI